MNQTKVIALAMQAKQLETNRDLAHALGVRDQRANEIRTGRSPVDEAEAIMLADWTGIPLSVLLAACALDREKQPAKRSFLEKIARPFLASAVLLSLCFPGTPVEAEAPDFSFDSLSITRIVRLKLRRLLTILKVSALLGISNDEAPEQHALRFSL